MDREPNRRFRTAMAVFALLFLTAFVVLHGLIRNATMLALALFAAKTVIAYKAQGR